VIGGDGLGTVPSGCSSQGTPQLTQSDFGSNGVLGIGMVPQDCGVSCTLAGSSNPGIYYACPTATTCQITAQPIAADRQSVSLFAADNNGVVLQLPAAQTGGRPR
jgi:hypothetical protein